MLRTTFARGLALTALSLFTGLAIAQESSIPHQLNLQAGDLERLQMAREAPASFQQIPGTREFTGEIIVRPRGAIRGAWTAKPSVLRRASDRVAPLITRRSQVTEQYLVRVPDGMNENEFCA